MSDSYVDPPARPLKRPATDATAPEPVRQAIGGGLASAMARLDDEEPPVAPTCYCGRPAKLCVTKKPGSNTGRKFWACPETERGKQCGESGSNSSKRFFAWADELAARTESGAPSAAFTRAPAVPAPLESSAVSPSLTPLEKRRELAAACLDALEELARTHGVSVRVAPVLLMAHFRRSCDLFRGDDNAPLRAYVRDAGRIEKTDAEPSYEYAWLPLDAASPTNFVHGDVDVVIFQAAPLDTPRFIAVPAPALRRFLRAWGDAEVELGVPRRSRRVERRSKATHGVFCMENTGEPMTLVPLAKLAAIDGAAEWTREHMAFRMELTL